MDGLARFSLSILESSSVKWAIPSSFCFSIDGYEEDDEEDLVVAVAVAAAEEEEVGKQAVDGLRISASNDSESSPS